MSLPPFPVAYAGLKGRCPAGEPVDTDRCYVVRSTAASDTLGANAASVDTSSVNTETDTNSDQFVSVWPFNDGKWHFISNLAGDQAWLND